jgi:CheY-like chemotaxis protein
MNKQGPIIVVEDDIEDQEMLADVFQQLQTKNQVIFFPDGFEAYEFLKTTREQPFLILSDLNMPKLSGFALRDMVHNNEDLRLKCIPYLFFTTSAEQRHIADAYSKSVQGFFTKPNSYLELVRIIKNIIEYWKDCHSPKTITPMKMAPARVE